MKLVWIYKSIIFIATTVVYNGRKGNSLSSPLRWSGWVTAKIHWNAVDESCSVSLLWGDSCSPLMTNNIEDWSICPVLAQGNTPPVQLSTTASINQPQNEASCFFQKTIISDSITYQCIRFDREYLKMENIVFKEPNFNFADFLYFLSISFIATLICIISNVCFGFSLLSLFHCLKVES